LGLPYGPAQKKTLELTQVKPNRFGLKVLAAILLCILALGQISYLGRNSIHHMIAKAPLTIQGPAKITFEAIDKVICDLLPCENKALSDFSAWAIEFADLEIYSSATKDNVRVNPESTPVTGLLKLQIRNKLNIAVVWPSMILSITDINDVLISEIVLTPQDWLPQELQSTPSEPSNAAPLQEVSSNFPLSLPEKSAGYRLRLSYVEKE
jgi:ribosomal protein L11 methyltransferase